MVEKALSSQPNLTGVVSQGSAHPLLLTSHPQCKGGFPDRLPHHSTMDPAAYRSMGRYIKTPYPPPLIPLEGQSSQARTDSDHIPEETSSWPNIDVDAGWPTFDIDMPNSGRG